MRTAIGVAVVLVFPVLLLLGLRALQRRRQLHPELARKLFHIGGGLVGLALPWLTPQPAVVILLTAVSISGLFLLSRNHRLEEKAGRVLSSVGRASLGDVCFPFSVCVLFLITRWNLVLYSVPLLVLTFGDAVAALIGVRYGLKRYAATDGFKSIEGSTAFFITAFFCVHVPLLLGTTTGRAECLLIAVMLGLLVMMVEAVAWNGLDNLFIPMASFILLRVFLRLTVTELVERLAVTALLALVVFLAGRRTTLNTSGLLGAIFVGYLLWVGGDHRWVIMPTLVFLAYRKLSPDSEWDGVAMHDIHVVLSVCLAGLAYLFCSETFGGPEFLLAATISFAAHLAIIGLVRWRLKTGMEPSFPTSAATVLGAWFFLFAPYAGFAVARHARAAGLLLDLALGFLGVVVGVAVYRVTPAPMAADGVDIRRWRWQGVAAAAGSLVGLLPIVIRASRGILRP